MADTCPRRLERLPRPELAPAPRGQVKSTGHSQRGCREPTQEGQQSGQVASCCTFRPLANVHVWQAWLRSQRPQEALGGRHEDKHQSHSRESKAGQELR